MATRSWPSPEMSPICRASSTLVPTPSVQATSTGSRMGGMGNVPANPVVPPCTRSRMPWVSARAASRLTPASSYEIPPSATGAGYRLGAAPAAASNRSLPEASGTGMG